MNPLAQAVAEKPTRPDPKHQLIEVVIGDESLTAECSVTGKFYPAITQADPYYCHPAEGPEVEVVRLWTADLQRDMSGLMEFGPLAGEVQDACEQYVIEHQSDGPDPDDTYDRWRDERMCAACEE